MLNEFPELSRGDEIKRMAVLAGNAASFNLRMDLLQTRRTGDDGHSLIKLSRPAMQTVPAGQVVFAHLSIDVLLIQRMQVERADIPVMIDK